MPNLRRDFLSRIFNTEKTIPAAVHREAWRHATETGDADLRRKLVARLDAPADLVALYETLTDSQLAGIVMARPAAGTSDTEKLTTLLAGERRSAVLIDALERSELHPAAIRAATDAFLARPTKALVDHIADLPAKNLTPALAEASLRVFDRTDPLTSLLSRRHQLRILAPHLGADRARTLLRDLRHPEVLGVVLSFDVGDEHAWVAIESQARFLLRLVDSRDSQKSKCAAQQFDFLLNAAVMADRHAGPIGSGLTALLAPVRAPRAAQWRQRLRTGYPAHYSAWHPRAGVDRPAVTDAELAEHAASGTTLPDPATATGDGLGLLLHSTDPDVLTQIVDRYIAETAHRTPSSSIVIGLLHNPALQTEDRHRLVLTLETLSAEGYSGLESLPAILMFCGDPVVAGVWCRLFPQQVLDLHGWEPFGGSSRAAELYREWANLENAYEARKRIEQALAAGVPDEAVLDTPATRIKVAWERCGTPAGGHAMLVLSRLIADRLGDSAAAWAAFWDLAPTFPGSLGDLLDVCAAAAY